MADQNIKDALGPRLLQQNKFFEELFNGLPLGTTHLRSIEERDKRRTEMSEAAHKSLVYGEIMFMPFACLWARCADILPAVGNGTFVDIGSGVGKGVFAAAILHNLSRGESYEPVNLRLKTCRSS